MRLVTSGFGMPLWGYFSVQEARGRRKHPQEVTMPVWAWILIIVLLVLLLTGGVYVRR